MPAALGFLKNDHGFLCMQHLWVLKEVVEKKKKSWIKKLYRIKMDLLGDLKEFHFLNVLKLYLPNFYQ